MEKENQVTKEAAEEAAEKAKEEWESRVKQEHEKEQKLKEDLFNAVPNDYTSGLKEKNISNLKTHLGEITSKENIKYEKDKQCKEKENTITQLSFLAGNQAMETLKEERKLICNHKFINTELEEKIKSSLIEKYLSHKYTVQDKDGTKRHTTLLHKAVFFPELIELIIGKINEANITARFNILNQRDNIGYTPLHEYAISDGVSLYELLKIKLDDSNKPMFINAKTYNGKTPLDLVVNEAAKVKGYVMRLKANKEEAAKAAAEKEQEEREVEAEDAMVARLNAKMKKAEDDAYMLLHIKGVLKEHGANEGTPQSQVTSSRKHFPRTPLSKVGAKILLTLVNKRNKSVINDLYSYVKSGNVKAKKRLVNKMASVYHSKHKNKVKVHGEFSRVLVAMKC